MPMTGTRLSHDISPTSIKGAVLLLGSWMNALSQLQTIYPSNCVFRSKVATNSGPIQPPVPIESSHPFQFKLGHSFRLKPATWAG